MIFILPPDTQVSGYQTAKSSQEDYNRRTTTLVYLSRLGFSAARGLNLWRCKARNLLENAIHYNNRGGAITIYIESSDTALDMLLSDSGIGFSEGDQLHIFENFYQVDSYVAGGSTFIVTLPLELPLETYAVA